MALGDNSQRDVSWACTRVMHVASVQDGQGGVTPPGKAGPPGFGPGFFAKRLNKQTKKGSLLHAQWGWGKLHGSHAPRSHHPRPTAPTGRTGSPAAQPAGRLASLLEFVPVTAAKAPPGLPPGAEVIPSLWLLSHRCSPVEVDYFGVESPVRIHVA